MTDADGPVMDGYAFPFFFVYVFVFFFFCAVRSDYGTYVRVLPDVTLFFLTGAFGLLVEVSITNSLCV